MIIAIDFDGTIVRGTYPSIDRLQPYAKEAITQLKEDGHYVIIWTCRSGEKLLEAINFLLQHGVPFDRINESHPDDIMRYGGSTRKINAHCYIDDRNLGGFNGWKSALELIGSPFDGLFP